jgi:hypothetical protein
MSSASQGPGWWQASDGKWYAPQQKSGYEAPPPPPVATPPAPPSSSAPPAPTQYPATGGQYSAPGGPNFGNAQAAFASGVGKIPRAGWIVVGGLVAALIGLFLPLANVSAEGILSMDVYWPGWAKFIGFLFVAGGLALTWATYGRLQTKQATLIGLSALVGLMIAHLILNWFTFDSESKGNGDLAGVDVSPGFGLLLYTLGLGVAAVGTFLIWRGRSTPQSRPY